MDSQRQFEPSQETPYYENKENLQEDISQSENKDFQPEHKERQENSLEQTKTSTEIKSHDEDKLTLIEEIDAFEKGFQYATDFLAGTFDTLVNLVRPTDNETEQTEENKEKVDEKFERFKKELIEKTSSSPQKSLEGHEHDHQHHQLHADSQSFKPTQESKMLVEQIIEGHEESHHHLSAESQSFKPNTETKILTEKIIEGLEDSSASLVEKAHEAEKEIEEVHGHHEDYSTPSKMTEKRKSDEFWLAEDGPVREQPKENRSELEKQEERVPLLDKVIHGYQAISSTLSYMKSIVSPAKPKIEEEGASEKIKEKEKRVVGADITNKMNSNDEENEEKQGKRKESWSGKIGRKFSETIERGKDMFNYEAQEDNPKIA